MNIKEKLGSHSGNHAPVPAGNREAMSFFGLDMLLLVRIAVSIILFCCSLILTMDDSLHMLLMLACFLVCGYDVILQGISHLFQQRYLDENLMMAIAALAAFAINAYYEGAAVMLVYQVGSLARQYAVSRTRETVRPAEYRPGMARLLENGTETLVDAAQIQEGNILSIHSGERVEADSVVLEGSSALDMSPITGEGRTIKAEPGSPVYAGAFNIRAPLTVRVTAPADESVYPRTLRTAQQESDVLSQEETMVQRIAHVYAPFALGISILIALILLIVTPSTVADAVHRALVLLIVTCPCTFLLSIPLCYYAGQGGAMRGGVYIRDVGVMDALSRAAVALFDKDRVLTAGKYRIVSVKSDRLDPNILLKVAAHAGCNSTLPAAQSVVEAYEGIIDHSIIEQFHQYDEGVVAVIDGLTIAMGTRRFLAEQGVAVTDEDDGSVCVCIALEGQYAGRISLSETVREGASSVVLELDAVGCESVMLTADSQEKAKSIADAVGIREFYSQCMPIDAMARIRELKERFPANSVLFIGDANADGGALSAADVGIAFNGLRSGSSLAGVDVAIMADAPEKAAEAVSAARLARGIVRQNLIIAGAVKGLLLLMALLGVSFQLWFASFIDVAAGLFCILNANRAAGSREKL